MPLIVAPNVIDISSVGPSCQNASSDVFVNDTDTPCSSTTSRVNSPRTDGWKRLIEQPCAQSTRWSRLFNESRSDATHDGRTLALPPPWGRPVGAYGPTRAIRPPDCAGHGSWSVSFVSSTVDPTAARYWTSRVTASSSVRSDPSLFEACAHSASALTRATDASIVASQLRPHSPLIRASGPGDASAQASQYQGLH